MALVESGPKSPVRPTKASSVPVTESVIVEKYVAPQGKERAMERAGMSSAPRFAGFVWLRPGRLVRPVDRVELALLIAAALIGLLVLPVALMLGSNTYTAQSQLAEQQSNTRHLVSATLLADVPITSEGGETGTATTSAVRATWRTPDGGTRVGLVSAEEGTRAGSAIPVWLDPEGNPVLRPLTPMDAIVSAITVTVIAWAVALALLAGLFLLARVCLDRCRSLAWQRQWAEIEPEWSHRTH